MVGITSYGAYIPIYRLARKNIGAMWCKGASSGERSVANADEDSLTMGVEATIDCLRGMDRSSVDALYFATVSPPYLEKQSSSIIRAAADLRDDIPTMDIAHSLRGSTSALRAAEDAVKASSAKNVMVVASDSRLAAPDSEFESQFGDGAVALLIGDTDVIATIDGSYHVSSEFIDVWRKPGDKHMQVWEDRFIREEGYLKILPGAVMELYKKMNIKPEEITKACFYGPDARTHSTMAVKMKLNPKTQVQDPLAGAVGNTGTALAPMILVSALEEAKPGDKILFATYGDGADAYLLTVTENITKVQGNRRGIKNHLESKLMLPSYGKYVQIRQLMEWEKGTIPARPSSLPVIWRDKEMVWKLYGQKCKSCGSIQLPRQRVCMYCRAKDNFEFVRLSDAIGTLFTFSMDERAQEIVLPKVFSVVDLDGGGRFYSVMTDRDTEKIEVGMKVEMTFRIQLEGSELINYFWRVRPIRC